MYNYGHMGGWGFGWVFMILFWSLVIWGVAMLLHRGSRGCSGMMHDHSGHGGEPALDILKRRYAKGEITREDFERMRKDIE